MQNIRTTITLLAALLLVVPSLARAGSDEGVNATAATKNGKLIPKPTNQPPAPDSKLLPPLRLVHKKQPPAPITDKPPVIGSAEKAGATAQPRAGFRFVNGKLVRPVNRLAAPPTLIPRGPTVDPRSRYVEARPQRMLGDRKVTPPTIRNAGD